MKILVLAGGSSSEREVSLDSGRSVCQTLQALGHEVQALDPFSGQLLLGSDGHFLTAGDSTAHDSGESVSEYNVIGNLDQPAFENTDIVFIALHGGEGEDGSIQNLLDMASIPYTGSGHTASAVAMDKAMTKGLCKSLGITTPAWKLYRTAGSGIDNQLFQDITIHFKPPFIVKPNDSGSTVGLTRVDDMDPLTPALITALGESTNILVEEYIAGRELTVSVLDGKPLPVVEIVPKNGLYDYEAKYTKGMSEYICPAKIDSTLAEKMQHDAALLYETIGASGLVRVDFILDKDNQYYCLELNTLPGMTALSLAPMAAKAAGIDFDDLVQRIINCTQQ